MPIKHHILPHPHRKKRATLLQTRAVFVYSLTILTIFSFFRGIPKVMPGVLGYASNVTVNDLLTYTNKKRAEAGVPELTLNSKLSVAAQKKAAYMFKHNFWAHIAPDGTDPWSFILTEGYDYVYAGENLAKNFSDSRDVVEAWYESPSHKENLLSDKYLDVGFASVNGVLDGYETTLIVQMFGRVKGAPAQVTVKNEITNTAERPAEIASQQPSVASHEVSSLPVSRKIDVYSSTKAVTLSFAVFMFVLFALDVWYSKRHAILKFTGHSFAHMVFLVFAIAVIYIALAPGRII